MNNIPGRSYTGSEAFVRKEESNVLLVSDGDGIPAGNAVSVAMDLQSRGARHCCRHA